jgi:Rod binding domain-containing protein
MNVTSVASAAPPGSIAARDAELKSTFQQAVAGMMFGQMLKSLRATVGKPAYIHGGQAEEMFQSQLDQQLVEKFTQTDGSPFIGELYRQFRIQLGLPPEDAAESPAPQVSPASQPAVSDQLAELTDSVQQARLVTERTSGATGTAALSALFRK